MTLHPLHPTPPLARIGREQPAALHLARAGQPRRAALEAFIGERFARHHGARISHFLPCLLGLEKDDGSLIGAVGLRPAGDTPLFLEAYLDRPVEQCIDAAPLDRTRIVEVGNLAADSPGAARLLIVALTDLLASVGFEWVVFTATRELHNSFQRLGLQPRQLAAADPARLGAEGAAWGSYYQHAPTVMAGHVLAGHQRLLQLGLYPRLGHQPLYAGGLPDVACC